MKKIALALTLLIGLAIGGPFAYGALEDWSPTAGLNNSSAPDGFPENMAPSDVNNSAREVMAQVRRWAEQGVLGTFATESASGANAYAMTPDIKPSAYSPGAVYWFEASTTNTGSATLNVASLGAKTIKLNNAALASGAIAMSDHVAVVYDATGDEFEIIGHSDAFGAVADDGISGDKIDGGTISTFTSTGIDDNATAEAIDITADEEVTMPSQPAVRARPASEQANIAADTNVTVTLGTEDFDQNADFASNTFTAPVTGKYMITAMFDLGQIDTAAANYELRIRTSNAVHELVIDAGQFSADLDRHGYTVSVLADMDAADTATMEVRQNGGAAQTDVKTESRFSVFLCC